MGGPSRLHSAGRGIEPLLVLLLAVPQRMQRATTTCSLAKPCPCRPLALRALRRMLQWRLQTPMCPWRALLSLQMQRTLRRLGQWRAIAGPQALRYQMAL